MKKKFTIVLERKGEEFVARCQELAGAVGHGCDKQEALENLKAVIAKILGEGGSDAGSAACAAPRPSVRPTAQLLSHTRSRFLTRS